LVIIGLACLVAAPALASDPSPGPEMPTLSAEGPFGTVAGYATASGARRPDLAQVPVLDAWARGATVAFRPSDGTLSKWHLWVMPGSEVGARTTYELTDADGDASVDLQEPGIYLLRVEGTIRADGGPVDGTWWWRVAVPYRDFPPDEHGPPPPALRLASADDIVTLEQGSGCFLGTCGDIGGISPPDLLPTVTTIEGAPLTITLGDGSGMVDWSIAVSPVGGDGSDETLLGRVRDTWMIDGWVAAPSRGDWLLSASVTFDRERGSFDGYGRLVVEEDPGP
jgi:hypothetical protein